MIISCSFFDIDLSIEHHSTYNRQKPKDLIFDIEIEALGKFWFFDKKKVLFIPFEKNYDAGHLHVYLNGTVLGLFLIMNETLTFHGSTFSYKNNGVLVIGESESGKSTTALNFCLNGAKFVSDDISPVFIDKHDFFIKPLKENLKIWKDALVSLGITSSYYEKVWGEEEKFVLEKKHELANLTLDVIFYLKVDQTKELLVRELTKAEKFKILRENIYCQEYLHFFSHSEKLFFDQLIELANQTKVYEIKRAYGIHPQQVFDKISKMLENL